MLVRSATSLHFHKCVARFVSDDADKMFELNVVDSVAQGLGRTCQGVTFTGAREQ